MAESDAQAPFGLSPAVFALPQISLQVDVHIDPANVEKFLEEFRSIFAIVAKEEELVYFEVFQDPSDPGHLSWVENWAASVEWLLTNQLQKEYYKPYLAATEWMWLKPREMKILKRFGGDLVVHKEGNLRKV